MNEINSKRLDYAVIAAGVNKYELAAEIGIHYSNFWRRMNGKAQWREGEREAIAHFLGVTLHWLQNEEARDDL